jgi:tRNA pseudouridine55 synthase
VRSLAHDLGKKLGCGAHLLALRRTVSGKFDVDDAVFFEDLMEMSEKELEQHVIPMLKLVAAE